MKAYTFPGWCALAACALAAAGCHSAWMSGRSANPLPRYAADSAAPEGAPREDREPGPAVSPAAELSPAESSLAESSLAESSLAEPTPAEPPLPSEIRDERVAGAAHVQPAPELNPAELPPPDGEPQPPQRRLHLIPVEPEEVAPGRSPLALDAVTGSIVASYPLLRSAVLERIVAEGKNVSAWGAFDTDLIGSHQAAPLGFYQNFRTDFYLSRAIWSGGKIAAGYRNGLGDIQPWYGERQTNDGGEFKVEWRYPFLRDRPIDKKRAEVFLTDLEAAAVEPRIQAILLDFVREGAQVYWMWVAAGRAYAVNRRLLDIARERQLLLEEAVKEGELPRLELVDNQRLIASREAKLTASLRKFQESAIKLSLYYRTADGKPIVATLDQVPEEFPDAVPLDETRQPIAVQEALTQRPEMSEIDFVRRQAEVELSYAENLMLPGLESRLIASKDLGGWASSKGDKAPFEMEAWLTLDVPLQRREARGKVQSASGKIEQIAAKRQFLVEKITAQVQDAFSALVNSYKRIEQARESVQLNEQLERAEDLKLEEGDSTIFTLNLRETATADARLVLIEAEADYFIAEAFYRAALGLDPRITP